MVNTGGVKRKHIYRLHRSEELDHKYGRPAILLNYRKTKSLVWAGTTKFDEFNVEEPLILKLNDVPVYFYGNAIDVIRTEDLKSDWIDNKTNKTYALSNEQQEAVLKKIISFSSLTDPYKKIDKLENAFEEKKIVEAKDKYKIKKFSIDKNLLEFDKVRLEKENEILKQENEKLQLNNQRLTMENDTLNIENQMLKTQEKTKSIQEYERN